MQVNEEITIATQLSEHLKRASVTGTADSRMILQDVAIETFQQKAGYVPSVLPDSAYLRQVHDDRPITPSRTTSQMYRMLLGDFQFETCFNEWCLLVAQKGMRLPPELIPSMLNSDLVFIDSWQVALLAMGNYARWIVAHNRHQKHWQWVMQMPTPSVSDVLEAIDNQSDGWIQQYEAKPHRIKFHQNLTSQRHLWNDALAECVLYHVQYLLDNVAYEQWRTDLKRLMRSFAYYAPLKYYDACKLFLEKLNTMYGVTFNIDQIIAYRHKLHHIIADEAQVLAQAEKGIS